MTELGESADPRALVPGDPTAVRAVGASMSRLGAGLVGAGDGLRRIDTTEWEGDAANAFRRAFDPIPDQWVGTGEAFLDAADAITEYADVLEWAQSEADVATADWDAAQQSTASTPLVPGTPDPGELGRAGAVDRLRRARQELRAAGDTATPVVALARDMAPPMPSVAQQLGSLLGDVTGGAWNELVDTGQFLWQIDPTRFLVEPAAAVEGWQDLGAGVANAVQHPRETVEQALNPRELATNPSRWLGSTLTGAGLSALGGAGAAGRAERVTRAAAALTPDDGGPDPQQPVLGRWAGLTAREHALNKGILIGRRGSAKSMKFPIREVDTVAEIDEIFDALSEGGQVVNTTNGRSVVLLEDGTYMTYRSESSTPPYEPALDINPVDDEVVRVHTPKRGIR